MTCRGHRQIRGRVPTAVVRGDLLDGNRSDHARVAEDPTPERVIAVDRAREHVVDPVLRLVLVHRDLLQHHLALGIDLVDGQRGTDEHLGEQRESRLGVLVQEAGVQVRGLLAGRRVG